MNTHDTHDIAELKSTIREVRFPMFTWQDEHGHLLSQPMTQEDVDEAGGIWCFTSTQVRHGESGLDGHEAGHGLGTPHVQAVALK